MNINMDNWWNRNSEEIAEALGEKPVPVYQFSNTNPIMAYHENPRIVKDYSY